jgi:hypothetical protein
MRLGTPACSSLTVSQQFLSSRKIRCSKRVKTRVSESRLYLVCPNSGHLIECGHTRRAAEEGDDEADKVLVTKASQVQST